MSTNTLPKEISQEAIQGALKHGWSIDANKTKTMVNGKMRRMLYLLKGDKATGKVTVDRKTETSFGGCLDDGCFETPNAVMSICRKSRPGQDPATYRSNQYFVDEAKKMGAPMPWPSFLDPPGPEQCSGIAVHNGPLTPSHSCVRVPDVALAKYIYERMQIGYLVVVHE